MAQPAGRPFTAFEERLAGIGTRLMSRLNVSLWRISGGRLGARFLYGAPVMLLTTTGRKTGGPRTTPLLYLEDGANFVTVASKAGSARHPAWYWNLLAHPDVEIEIGSAALGKAPNCRPANNIVATTTDDDATAANKARMAAKKAFTGRDFPNLSAWSLPKNCCIVPLARSPTRPERHERLRMQADKTILKKRRLP